MRRLIAVTIIALTLAACSPYDTPAAGQAVSPNLSTPTAPLTRGYAISYATSVRASVPCDRACWTAVIARQRAERAWWAEVVATQRRRAEAARIARTYAYAHAIEQARLARLAAQSGGRIIDGIEVCNGRDLPSCAIVRRESRFDPNARNPRSSAWGLYQFLRGTWRGVCPEYPHGSASVAQQVECARRLWAGGRGASHWST